MHDQSNDDDNKSLEMHIINVDPPRSSLSNGKNIRQKSIRTKNNSLRWRNNITKSIKHRRNILSKALQGTNDSFIRIPGHDFYLISKEPNKITINVSGNRYQTHLTTLENYPNTLLGNKQKRKSYWNKDDNEYYFDRHRACFEAILYYYQSKGRLRRPTYVPLDTFLEEVSFFDLGSEAISQITKLENVSIVKHIDLPKWFWRRYIWFYFEYPQASIFAKILHFISLTLTFVSCITIAIETLPDYKNKWNRLHDNGTSPVDDIFVWSEKFSSSFFIIQTICVIYFSIEFFLRLISTPSYWTFILSIFNWIDLGAIVPYFVFLALVLNREQTELNGNALTGLRIFRILRLLRILKIYLIFKQFKTLRVLSSTLKESFLDFIIMVIILTLMAFIFGAATYYAEQDINSEVFDSIFKATYWGILTITTVGYGDMYPISVVGRVLACVCAFFGVATSAILVSALVERYQQVYNRKQFSPEQIISAVDPSDSEHDEKQDFINRKLSGVRKPLSFVPIAPLTTAATPSILSPVNYKKYLGHNTSTSNIRFIISIADDQRNNTSLHQIVNELMEELTVIVKNNGSQLNLKLINTETDSSIDRTSTDNELSPI